MSRLEDELDRVPGDAAAPTRGVLPAPVGPAGLVDVECTGCRRRFSTDSGTCPWCGHGAVLSVPPVAPAGPSAPVPVGRPAVVTGRAAIGIAAACAVVTAAILATRAPARPPARERSAATAVTAGASDPASATAPTTADPATTQPPAAPVPVPSTPASTAPTSTAPASSAAVTTQAALATTAPVAATTTPNAASTAGASLPEPPATTAPPATSPRTTVAPVPTTVEPAGVDARSIDVVEAYARAISTHDWVAAGALIPSVVAGPGAYATLYGAVDSMEIVVLSSGPGPAPGTRVVRAGQVLVETGADGARSSRLLCARYVVDPSAGVLRSVHPSALATVPGAVRAGAVRDELSSCALA